MDEMIQEQAPAKQAQPKKDKPQVAQVTFRAPEDVRNWIEQEKTRTGKNKEDIILDAMNGLILKRAQEAFPSRGATTAEFESHINTIMRMYVASIEMCENSENRIREEFAKELDRTKELLDEKMSQIRELKVQLVDLAGASDLAKELQKQLDVADEQARRDKLDYEERLADKSRALKDADARLAMLEIKADGYDDLKEERDSLDKKLQKAIQDKKDMEKDHATALERAAREAEKAQNDAVATANAAKDSVIEDLRNKLQDAKIQAARDLQEAEKAAHEADRASAAEIRGLEQENARLREQLAALRV